MWAGAGACAFQPSPNPMIKQGTVTDVPAGQKRALCSAADPQACKHCYRIAYYLFTPSLDSTAGQHLLTGRNFGRTSSWKEYIDTGCDLALSDGVVTAVLTCWMTYRSFSIPSPCRYPTHVHGSSSHPMQRSDGHHVGVRLVRHITSVSSCMYRISSSPPRPAIRQWTGLAASA